MTLVFRMFIWNLHSLTLNNHFLDNCCQVCGDFLKNNQPFFKLKPFHLPWSSFFFFFLFIVSADLSWQEGSFDYACSNLFSCLRFKYYPVLVIPLAGTWRKVWLWAEEVIPLLSPDSVNSTGDFEKGLWHITMTMLVWISWKACVTGEEQRSFYVLSPWALLG